MPRLCHVNAEWTDRSWRSLGHYTSSSVLITDPFRFDETDPINTQALESSLWELLSHRSHYHATVSTLCKIFTEPFTKPSYPLEDFLDHTYATVSSLMTKKKKLNLSFSFLSSCRGFFRLVKILGFSCLIRRRVERSRKHPN